MPNANLMLFLGEALVYAAAMIGLLHLRTRLGLGVFVAALGVMHFIETYLAAVFYVQLPFGVISPGSAVFFSGKLMMILLLYVKEDAATVRQPIYGLLAGNFLTVALSLLLRQHDTVAIVQNRVADIAFIDEMGWLMVWGTTLLYFDAIIIILLYERLGRWFRRFVTIRFLISGAAVLTLDQIGFYTALHFINGAPFDVFWGGWMAKMLAAPFYALAIGFYLTASRHAFLAISDRPLADVFNDLTFRERYEDLLSRAGHDTLTGALDRGRFESEGQQVMREAAAKDKPVSLLLIDVDRFKSVNDTLGHMEGDRVLKKLVETVRDQLRPVDRLFRYGGEEFIVLCPGLAYADAHARAEDIRLAVLKRVATSDGQPVTISIGVSATLADGTGIRELLSEADVRLYAAKSAGRNHVVGR
ncbi:GGDEF domain-containing protein [Sinorhizobium alkalisoli]|uniref:diguanylate cyclase n=1 Tax=Sinorhizobium alkalisoli TaxID=1752398 RepID=A0A1E3VHQ9_9HYPH|nr:GGDEF domain-containing protein [Sinorhizobium alkalisoli]MCA1493912.1 GGDEF domain-containing protein [Ensifer sp. NBAIM29]MCG5478273.1 GGDEF domain-containing protein [Sinorhizobium alkalisoli]ODR92641.1 diguanylate cyclase [Sinorhizobium alkalisoli]